MNWDALSRWNLKYSNRINNRGTSGNIPGNPTPCSALLIHGCYPANVIEGQWEECGTRLWVLPAELGGVIANTSISCKSLVSIKCSVYILMVFEQLLEQTHQASKANVINVSRSSRLQHQVRKHTSSPNLHTPNLYQDFVLNKTIRNPFEMSNFCETSLMCLTSLPCLSGVKLRITCPLKAKAIPQLDLKVLEP